MYTVHSIVSSVHPYQVMFLYKVLNSHIIFSVSFNRLSSQHNEGLLCSRLCRSGFCQEHQDWSAGVWILWWVGGLFRRNRFDSFFPDGSAEPGTLDTASVEPFPIVVATGESITLSVQLTLNEPVPVGAQVSIKIKKEGLIDIPLPCLEIDGLHLGSW